MFVAFRYTTRFYGRNYPQNGEQIRQGQTKGARRCLYAGDSDGKKKFDRWNTHSFQKMLQIKSEDSIGLSLGIKQVQVSYELFGVNLTYDFG